MLTARPLVSFVIPCYNYGRFLPECLAGIFTQQGGYDDYEIIAIDDCSTDDTWEILTACQDPRLNATRHSVNQGHVRTITAGLAAARGKYVARIDPDDRYRPNFLATLLPLLERSARIGMAYGDAAMIDAAGQVTWPCFAQPHGEKAFCGPALFQILEKNYICAPSAIARREAWQKHIPIWEGLAFSDWYFNVMIARDYEFAYVPELVADYRVHPANHHSRIIFHKLEELSVLRVLDWVFRHPEADPVTERRKQQAKRRIYAVHYLDQAEKYFGAGHCSDARRCYWEALRRQPSRVLRPGPLRRLMGSLLGRRRYDALKRRWVVGVGSPAGASP
jgi:glycosyltransferase involved in cell wall biosynthesis